MVVTTIKQFVEDFYSSHDHQFMTVPENLDPNVGVGLIDAIVNLHSIPGICVWTEEKGYSLVGPGIFGGRHPLASTASSSSGDSSDLLPIVTRTPRNPNFFGSGHVEAVAGPSAVIPISAEGAAFCSSIGNDDMVQLRTLVKERLTFVKGHFTKLYCGSSFDILRIRGQDFIGVLACGDIHRVNNMLETAAPLAKYSAEQVAEAKESIRRAILDLVLEQRRFSLADVPVYNGIS